MPVLSLLLALNSPSSSTVDLQSLSLDSVRQGWGKPQINRSITEKPLSLGGKIFAKGLGSHAPMRARYLLDGRVETFSANVGVDDGAGGKGSVIFRVYVDGRLAAQSPLMRGGQPPFPIGVPLLGAETLSLEAVEGSDGIDFDHADWAEAEFSISGQKPKPIKSVLPQGVLRTPTAPLTPRLNAAARIGARPGKVFLYRIPCQGRRPIVFSALNLPDSLHLDPTTGIITGRTPSKPGDYAIEISAKSSLGKASQSVTLVIGEKLALTPPMGWNSWYSHYHRVSQDLMLRSARKLASSGLADLGYSIVGLDDCWAKRKGDEPIRDGSGRLIPNSRFADMKAMTDEIHGLGLLAGIYTSPGPWTCAGFAGSWSHEELDAKTFADWGFDLLKYDWCSYDSVAVGKGITRARLPYDKIGKALRKQERDIQLNLCQYGMDKVWTWGASAGGQSWRTTGDLGVMGSFWRPAEINMKLSPFAGPGSWNDPDYILIGWVGDAFSLGRQKPVDLTSEEQYSYMSLWSLMASPLFFAGDLEKLDAFTFNVLANPEVIAVNQDPLGKQAKVVKLTPEACVLLKPLSDGTLAFGLFNRTEGQREMSIDLSQGGRREGNVMDVWTHKKIPYRGGRFTASVQPGDVFFGRVIAGK